MTEIRSNLKYNFKGKPHFKLRTDGLLFRLTRYYSCCGHIKTGIYDFTELKGKPKLKLDTNGYLYADLSYSGYAGNIKSKVRMF